MSCRVVVVEDNADLRVLLSHALEVRDCELVASFDSVAKALVWEGWSLVDVAVVDWQLPQQTGDVLLRWLFQSHPQVHRVMVSGTPLDYIDEAALDYVDDFVAKPFSTDRLVKLIETASHGNVRG